MTPRRQPAPREGFIPVDNAELYVREIGLGEPIFILHGGPDFDHTYLLPEMDRLSASFRLIYYDQRGRGRSARHVKPGDVSIASEIEDLERLRRYFQLEKAAVLGHSWGGLLAMEYTLHHPECVSHLLLMNTAPASSDDYMLFSQERRRTNADDVERLMALSSTAGYQQGDLETDAEYYRIHFGATLRQPELLERVVNSLRSSFTPEGILKAREIEDRLMDETWLSGEYNLFPRLEELRLPALVIHGEYDLLPLECAAHIAHAIPGARFISMSGIGHFSYLERPNEVFQEISDFLHST